ncbi:ankyrin repeat-containing domain protein [Pyronema domesticum]|nr:ankyrin repeat-containing domain protein [Pyronema domesticum]
MSGDIDSLRWLLDEGADVNARDSYSLTALHIVATISSPQAAKLLLQRGTFPNAAGFSTNRTPLHYAISDAENCKANVILPMLLNGGANFDSRDTEGVTPLLKAADVEAKGNRGLNALHIVACSACGRMALHIVAEYHPEYIRLLLDHGADIHAQYNGDDRTALHIVAEHHPEYIPLLLERGAEINARRDDDGKTALYIVAEFHPKKIPLLLQYGTADINAKCGWGETALHIVARLHPREAYIRCLWRMGQM